MTQITETKSLIVEYSHFYAELSELEKENGALVFDYESKKGNKDARSHIAKLRKLNPRIEAVRKGLKEEFLVKGRAIDGEAKEIARRVEEMISVHLKPVEAIEQREAERVAKIRTKINDLNQVFFEANSRDLAFHLNTLNKAVIDEGYAEFQEEAKRALEEAIKKHTELLEVAQKREADALELERLKAENQSMADEKRAQEMAAETIRKAQIESDRKAMHEVEEARQRELKLQQEIERAKRAEQEAIQQLEREKQEEARMKAEREANIEHTRSINRAIKTAFVDAGFSDDDAKKIVTLVLQKKIPNISIVY